MNDAVAEEAVTSTHPHGAVELFTEHALKRMGKRGITIQSVFQVMSFGRVLYRRGATIFVIGKKEVQYYQRDGVDLQEHEGIHVVVSRSGNVMTVYRNRALSRLRPRRRMPRRWLKANRRRELDK